jgi:hypothetical protein
MITEIKWIGEETVALGRNGYMKCKGAEVFTHSDNKKISISPITSKGMVGRSFIEIPLSDIDMVCWVLQEEKKRIMREKGGSNGR